jgi:hypothetical protein
MSKWTPQNDEPALTLAAIRWYGLSIEKLATDLYLTNREMYPDVKEILSTAFTALGQLRGYCIPEAENGEAGATAASKTGKGRWPAGRWADRLRAEGATYASDSHPLPKPLNVAGEQGGSSEDGCAPGYVDCNGVCLPECDRIAEY